MPPRKQQAVPLHPKPQLAELLFRPVGLNGFYQSASKNGYRSRHHKVQTSTTHEHCCNSEAYEDDDEEDNESSSRGTRLDAAAHSFMHL
jgi:hypothetical protein